MRQYVGGTRLETDKLEWYALYGCSSVLWFAPELHGARWRLRCSPFFDVLGKETHVFLPEVADDLRDCQYAPRIELGGAWGGGTLPQEKQRIGTIILTFGGLCLESERRSRRRV